MVRTLPELALLYLAPFALYVLYLILRRVYILSLDHWTRSVIALLSLTGLAFMVCGLLATGFFADRHEGAYTPAHIENGQIIPGHIE